MKHRESPATALITGASAGLGQEFARLFAADGYNVVLVARRRERLEELAHALEREHPVRTEVIVADLRDAQAPECIKDEIASRDLRVDALVNNAGFGKLGAFSEHGLEVALEMLAVNVRALVHLTHLLLPHMLGQRSGHVLNIGSMAGFLPGPYMGVYYATKAFVNSFSQALAEELNGTGVHVTVCCPGPTATEFGTVAGASGRKLIKANTMSARAVALGAYRSMQRNQVMNIPGVKNNCLVQLLRLMPRSMVRRIAARTNRFSGTPSK
jgi:short-subunit dehydrogenase